MPDEIKKKARSPQEAAASSRHGDRQERQADADRQAEARGERQPGGGRHSESEKPDSPESRWGSGRKP